MGRWCWGVGGDQRKILERVTVAMGSSSRTSDSQKACPATHTHTYTRAHTRHDRRDVTRQMTRRAARACNDRAQRALASLDGVADRGGGRPEQEQGGEQGPRRRQASPPHTVHGDRHARPSAIPVLPRSACNRPVRVRGGRLSGLTCSAARIPVRDAQGTLRRGHVERGHLRVRV